MKKMRKALVVIVAVVIAQTAVPTTAEASTKNATLNKKSVTLKMTDKKPNPTVTLKVKNASVVSTTWASSNKKVATVNRGKVTAKKAGKATITCTITSGWGVKKTLKCKVVVKDKRTPLADAATAKKLKVTFVKATKEDNRNYFKVTYDGKDVTNKVTYKTTLDGKEYSGFKANIKKGVLIDYPNRWPGADGRFDIVITYKVNNKIIKKTVKLKHKDCKEVWCVECDCGWTAYGNSYEDIMDRLDEHEASWMNDSSLVYTPEYINCTGNRYKSFFIQVYSVVK